MGALVVGTGEGLVVGIDVGGDAGGSKTGELVGALVDGAVGALVPVPLVGLRVTPGDDVGTKVGAVVFTVGETVGVLVGSTKARHSSEVANTWHWPSQSPPRKHSPPESSLNRRFPGAGQEVESTFPWTKFNVPEYVESSSTKTTKVESESRKQLCWIAMKDLKKANA